MPFVQRDTQGKVQGCFARPQPLLAEELLPDDSPEVVAFLSPKIVDLSDIENLEKAIKVFGRLLAQYTGKTLVQVRQDFRTIWQAMP